MSRIICIGDLHGHETWKAIVNKEMGKATRFIAIGDYFDSDKIHFNKIGHNYLDLCAFKNANHDLVKMLIGNHEAHYMKCARSYHEFRCSGFDEDNMRTAYTIMDRTDNVLQMAYEEDGILFTHAGVTATWAYDNLIDNSSASNMAASINQRWAFSPLSFAYKAGYGTGEGDHPIHSPLWVRRGALRGDRIIGLRQIVGHTPRHQIVIHSSVDAPIFIDTLHVGQYLIIENGEYSVGEVYGN